MSRRPVADYPAEIREALGLRGWSKDEQISPERAFSEFCEWHGLGGWGRTLYRLVHEINAMGFPHEGKGGGGDRGSH